MKLVIAKYLDVKTPFKKSPLEAGIDLFIPKLTSKAIGIIQDRSICTDSSENLYMFKADVDTPMKHIAKDFGDELYTALFHYLIEEGKDTDMLPMGHYIVTNYKRFVIPSGIAIDYPDNYYGDITNRSSNFKRGLLVQVDASDNSFVEDGNMFQVYNMTGDYVVLKSDERIAQLILREFKHTHIEEIPHDEFQALGSVQWKRTHRDGGFGSSGK